MLTQLVVELEGFQEQQEPLAQQGFQEQEPPMLLVRPVQPDKHALQSYRHHI